MCGCVCWCVILRKVSATGSAPWLVWSLAWGSVSGYSLDNHSKPGCLPIAPSKRSGGKPAEQFAHGVKRVKG